MLIYCVLGQTQPLTQVAREIISSLPGEVLVLLIWVVVCLCAALWVQLFVSTGNAWPHNALQYHLLMPISCHFQDCKVLQVTSLDLCK